MKTSFFGLLPDVCGLSGYHGEGACKCHPGHISQGISTEKGDIWLPLYKILLRTHLDIMLNFITFVAKKINSNWKGAKDH